MLRHRVLLAAAGRQGSSLVGCRLSESLIDRSIMEKLEQKCHDLDVKIRRLEEERNTLLHDNEELVEELQKHAPESQRAEHDDDRIKLKADKVFKLSEDIGRLGISLSQLSDSHLAVADRLKDIPELKLTIKVSWRRLSLL